MWRAVVSIFAELAIPGDLTFRAGEGIIRFESLRHLCEIVLSAVSNIVPVRPGLSQDFFLDVMTNFSLNNCKGY